MADGLKTSISTNRQNGKCFATSTSTDAQDEDKLAGKYGDAKILQDASGTSLVCGIEYAFKSAGVSDKLAGKKIVLKVTEDSVLRLEKVGSDNETTVEKKYLPSAFR